MVNPQKAIETIETLLKNIEDISKKEYNEDTTVREFADLVFEILRFVRLSGIKGLKERHWYSDYYDFSHWCREGVRVGNCEEFFDESKEKKKKTIGKAYEYDISKLKIILNDCKKDFEMIQQVKGSSSTSKKPSIKKENTKNIIKQFLPVIGKWEIKEDIAKYLGPDKEELHFPHGLVLLKEKMKNGTIRATVRFEKGGNNIARVVYGYDSKTKSYYSMGIGGYDFAYVIDIFTLTSKGPKWQGLALEGRLSSILKRDKDYLIELTVEGLKIILKIDGVQIFDYKLPNLPQGHHLGIFSWGKKGGTTFRNISVEHINPKAFVIMRFRELQNTLYKKSIKSICENIGVDAYRVDEVYKPGIILNDIIKGIAESEMLIAEITPSEHVENVYYEVGFAHALKKPTILLAKKGCKLPFDIQGYRVIFYDDNDEKGIIKFEEQLKKHISNILKNII
jgi:hypothetical protein